ncbi:MAG: hypothetical protein IPG78_00740 [Ignavibacteria bacterium]|nr:hypothetical protein [Ignavibacteria bacterium]
METTFEEDKKLSSGTIHINVAQLGNFLAERMKEPISIKTGTKVSFFNITIPKQEFELIIIPFLICEFGWYLELNKNKGYNVLINDIPWIILRI